MTDGHSSGKERIKAVAYMRTSSATNVGEDKDSEQRQRQAIERFAAANGYQIAEGDWFYDAAVSGTDPVGDRPGWKAMELRIRSDGVRTIIVETANRLARDLMVQEVAYAMLRDGGITLIAADSPNSFLDDGPTATLIRQILGAVAQFDRSSLTAKLKGARDRKSNALGRRIEGRKRNAEKVPEAVAMAKRLHRKNPKTGERRSLRKIAAELEAAGHINERGRRYDARSILEMIKRQP